MSKKCNFIQKLDLAKLAYCIFLLDELRSNKFVILFKSSFFLNFVLFLSLWLNVFSSWLMMMMVAVPNPYNFRVIVVCFRKKITQFMCYFLYLFFTLTKVHGTLVISVIIDHIKYKMKLSWGEIFTTR